MSFLAGGAECSTSGNPLSQFSKHVQDDKSLQRDRLVGRGPSGMQDSFRGNLRDVNGNGMMDEFMQQHGHIPQPNASPLAMEQMRREFESLQTSPSHRNASPQWAKEFDPGMDETARMEAAFRSPQPHGGFSPADFEGYARMKQASSTEAPMSGNAAGYMRPMGMGYGGMYGGVGQGLGAMGGSSMLQRPYGVDPVEHGPMHGKGKGRMVELDDKDWESEFAQLEANRNGEQDVADSDEAQQRAIDAELEEIDRSVLPSEDNLGEFDEVWRKIQAEDTERNMLDSLDDDQWRSQHPGDFAEWDNFDGGLNAHVRDPQLGDYLFEEENLFNNVGDPYGEGVRIMDSGGNLSLAALAFEAAVQKDPDHVEAWSRLGAAQAQNEKEAPAIRALEQAIKRDRANLGALMGLAVSYTNEGYDTTAYRTLERWLQIKYPQLSDQTSKSFAPGVDDPEYTDALGFTDRQLLHERVTNLFIRAAQLSPTPETMDPDVQVGLGVLFYGAEEFDKAVDCFGAALASSEAGSTNSDMANQRPLLWNRLGATLANSGRSEEAIQAYEKALELNPNFVRARYNLGVSCINIGCYAEAAQHLLGALAMHAVVEKEGREKAKEIVGEAQGAAAGLGVSEQTVDHELERIMRHNQSTNLYDTLRRVFGQMGRKDLADKVVAGVDVDAFRGEFDF